MGKWFCGVFWGFGMSRMKADEDFAGMERKAFAGVEADLRQWLAEIESHEAAKADAARDIKDSYVVAKSKGYNVKALRRLVALRKRDAASEAEVEDALVLYKRCVGML